eukprot:1344678-Lingulodinium_polyedra.AAC.1
MTACLARFGPLPCTLLACDPIVTCSLAKPRCLHLRVRRPSRHSGHGVACAAGRRPPRPEG